MAHQTGEMRRGIGKAALPSGLGEAGGARACPQFMQNRAPSGTFDPHRPHASIVATSIIPYYAATHVN
jgi:hypothetical protein